MPDLSDGDLRAFNKRVSDLLRAAAAAESEELKAVLRAIHAAQLDMIKLAGSDGFGVQLAAVKKRLAALDVAVTEMLSGSVPAAAARGVSLVDAGMEAAGIATKSKRTQVGVGALADLQSTVSKHVADMYSRMVHQLSRLAGPLEYDLSAVVAAIGTELKGSAVFGAPASFIAGSTRATLGDVTGAAMVVRADELAADGAPRTLKRWVHSSGVQEPRSSHLAAQSKYAAGIPWDQKFEIGRYRTLYPRGAGLPGVHRFGCRCQVAPVLALEES